MKQLIILLFLSVAGAFSLSAQCTWTGAVNNNWSEAGNWSCGHVPGAADAVVIAGGMVTLDVADVMVSTMNMSNGTLTGNNDLTLSGGLTWSGGTIGGTGAMTVTGVATLTNGTTLDTRALTLNGGGLFDNYLNMNNFANLVIPAGKTLTCNTSGNTSWGGSEGILTLAGTLIKNGPGYLTFDVLVFQNTGTINLNQGDIYLGFWGKNGTHTNATFNIAAGSFLGPNGGTHTFTNCAINGDGNFFIGSNGTIENFQSGNTIIADIYIASGTININHNISPAGNITMVGGNLGGTGNINLGGNLNWSGGTIGGTGALTVAGTTTLTNGTTLDTRTLTLNGGGSFDSYLNMNNFANLVIPAGRTLTCTTSGNTPWGGTDGTLTLAGTLIKNGPGFLAFDVLAFQNTGTINLNQGDIYLGFWGKTAHTPTRLLT